MNRGKNAFWRFRFKESFPESLESYGPKPRRARAQILPNFAISVLSCPAQRAWKGPGPDLAKFGYFCSKLSCTESLEGPGPDLAKFGCFCIKLSCTESFQGPGPRFSLLFLHEAALCRETGMAQAQIWPNFAIFVLSSPLQNGSKSPARQSRNPEPFQEKKA